MAAFSRKDDLFASLAVVMLLIGTATGSAIAMILISVIAMALMVVFNHKELKRREYRNGVLHGCARGGCHCHCDWHFSRAVLT